MQFGQSPELLTNTGFETGDPPTGWTLAGAGASWARSDVQKYSGTYSGLLTRAGTNCWAFQQYADYAKYKGLSATFDSWIYATVASRARLYLTDNLGGTYSLLHSGAAGWELLSTTHTVNVSATFLDARCRVETGDTAVYFDEASLFIPNLAMSRDLYGHPVQNSGSVWHPIYGRLFDGVDDIITVPDHTAIQNIFDAPGGTIIAWINATSVGEGSEARIWDKGEIRAYVVTDSGSGTCKFRFFKGFGTAYGMWDTANYVIPYGRAKMISVSYDSSDVANVPVICIDGSPVAITEVQTPIGGRLTDVASPFTTGNNVATSRTFDGYIPEVMAFKGRMLSIPEQQAIFQATRGRYGV